MTCMLDTLKDERVRKGVNDNSQRDGETSRIGIFGAGGEGQEVGVQKCEMRPKAAWVHFEHETHSDYETRGSCVMLLHGYKTT